MADMQEILQVLRAAAEGTRLRLLVLCAEGELTVSELTQITGQSQPRISRHLKLLVEGGYLKKEMVNEFVKFYGKNIINESTLINGVKEFLKWCKDNNISMAVCTNKQEYLSNDLLKKIGIYDYFEYVAGSDTFDYCKPDPRHLTSVVEILNGDIKKTIMIGDSETDANAAKAAEIPIILLKDGYTEKNIDEIYHNHLINDFIGIEKIISKYL